MKSFTWYLTLALVAFVLHTVWENLHISLYQGYEGLFWGLPVWLGAVLGDVLYTLLAAVVLVTFKQEKNYAAFALIGFCIAVLVEIKAILLSRWAYSAAMPTLVGIGLSPVLQMTLLLPLCVYLANKISTKLTA